MNIRITGGTPADGTRSVSDAEMKQIKALQGLGFGAARTHDIDVGRVMSELRKQRYADQPSPAAAYREARARFDAALSSRDPRVIDALAPELSQFKASLSSGDVHVNKSISELSTQYASEDMIGLRLAPAVPVSLRSDTYFIYGKSDRLQTHDNDELSETGEAPTLKESRTTATYSCVSRGNKSFVTAEVLGNQDPALDEMMDMTESALEHRALRREIRIADVFQTAANYPTGNKATLSGNDQWSSDAGGNPEKNIQDARAALWRGKAPSDLVAWSGIDVADVLARHPNIVGHFLYGGSPVGLATPLMIASLFRLDDYVIGEAQQDTAHQGDTASYGRVWSGFFGLARVARRPSRRSATFCNTFRWSAPELEGNNGGIITRQWFKAEQGLGGVYYAFAGEAEDHKVQASDTGYLYTAPVA